MKFLIVSERGDFNGAALRLVKEGHSVKIWFKIPGSRKTMVGLIPQVGSVQEGLRDVPDVVVFDMVGQGALADKLRSDGWKTIGGGKLNDDLELDRAFGARVMESFGIGTPRTFAFPNFSDASKFVLTHRRRLVFKPSGNLQTGYTYTGQGNDEVLNFISQLKTVRGIDGPCVLQEFVEGTEVSTEVWYSQGKPVAYPNSTVELKKFMPFDLGVSTGSMASIVWPYPVRQPRLVQKLHKKMGILLEKKKYTGPLDINAIVSNGRLYAIEFSARFGYNALYALLPLVREDLGSLLYRLAAGEGERGMDLSPGFGCSLRVSIPPYPFESDDPEDQAEIYEATRGYYVEGVEKNAWGKTVFPLDCHAKPGGICTSGFDGIIAEVAGAGVSVDEAYRNAEATFYAMSLPNKQARLKDIVRTTERRLSELAAMKYDVPSAFPVILSTEPIAPVVPHEPQKEKTNESKSVPVPAHMARTTVSMPTKLG